MPTTKVVHAGGIIGAGGTTITFVAPSRTELVADINVWLYNHFKELGETVLPLPPLDDWNHSHEDDTNWSIKFPGEEWVVWIRYESVAFK